MTHPILNEYPCGCEIRQGENDAYIRPCAMHEAAPDLLEACRATVEAFWQLSQHLAFADDAPEFNEGGIGYEAALVVRRVLAKAERGGA